MAKTVPTSKFIENYNQHLTEAERTGDAIVLQQRGGRPAWVLESEGRVRDTQAATDFLAAALTALVHDDDLVDRFSDVLASTLPWVSFLPDEERRAFAEEVADTLRASASLGRYTAFANLIEDWQSTAELWSDPALARSQFSDRGAARPPGRRALSARAKRGQQVPPPRSRYGAVAVRHLLRGAALVRRRP